MIGKLLVIGSILLLLVGSVSAYYCIYQEDNDAVMKFKYNTNILSFKQDINDGLTPEQIELKLKYFGPCR